MTRSIKTPRQRRKHHHDMQCWMYHYDYTNGSSSSVPVAFSVSVVPAFSIPPWTSASTSVAGVSSVRVSSVIVKIYSLSTAVISVVAVIPLVTPIPSIRLPLFSESSLPALFTIARPSILSWLISVAPPTGRSTTISKSCRVGARASSRVAYTSHTAWWGVDVVVWAIFPQMRSSTVPTALLSLALLTKCARALSRGGSPSAL